MPHRPRRAAFLLFLALAASPAFAQERVVMLSEVLEGIAAAPHDASARDRLGAYVRSVIVAARDGIQASGKPAFCVEPGAGRFDAAAFRDYALARNPTGAGRDTTPAAPVIVAFISANYPCR